MALQLVDGTNHDELLKRVKVERNNKLIDVYREYPYAKWLLKTQPEIKFAKELWYLKLVEHLLVTG